MTLPFETLPPAPPALDAVGVLVRLVDGMGFRYRWATEDLSEGALAFRPCEGAMTLGEVLSHMNVLVRWVDASVRAGLAGDEEGLPAGALEPPEAWSKLREDTLERLVALRDRLAGADPLQLKDVTITTSRKKEPQTFWHFINGPLADFLTHVGQVASWRRMSGEPGPRADVFHGLPPRG